jgi:hypothetical protein
LVLFTTYEPGTLTSVSRIAGYPVVAIAQEDPVGLIAIGQVGAKGVVVFAQLGYGLIAAVQGGVGLLFAVSQLGAGLILIGQLGIGLTGFIGQVGFGLQARGQAVGFRRSSSYFAKLGAELGEVLTFR